MYRCSQCSYTTPLKLGKCPECQSWGTFGEFEEKKGTDKKAKTKGTQREILKIVHPAGEEGERGRFASEELNAVLGGGLMPGSFILLSGEPGIGKSTLALQMADWYCTGGKSSLYISSEESAGQLSSRAKRLGIGNDGISILTTMNLEDIIGTIESCAMDFIIIDSVSVISSSDVATSSGSISQIRYIAERLMETAKSLKKTIVLIGHITKDGAISGPKILEHLVDTVLFLEGSRYESYRILRALKNRFGPTDEVGLFSMTETGLRDIKDPGMEFVNADDIGLPGSALSMTLEGSRPMLIEIEALTTYTKFGYPKRSSRGIGSGKLDLLIAIVTRFTETKLESYDVYLNVSRGMTVQDPSTDLASIAAIISSRKGKPLGKAVFIGEVSLTGIVKNISQIDKRVHEAIKLGFERIIVPAGSLTKKDAKDTHRIIEVKHVKEIEKMIERSLQ